LQGLFSTTHYIASSWRQDRLPLSTMAQYQGSEHAFSLNCELFC